MTRRGLMGIMGGTLVGSRVGCGKAAQPATTVNFAVPPGLLRQPHAHLWSSGQIPHVCRPHLYAGASLARVAPQAAALSDTHVIRPNLLNEVRVGYSRTNPYTIQPDYGHQAATSLGIEAVNISKLTSGIPNVTITKLNGLSGGPTFIPVNNKQTNLEGDDSIFWSHGRHNIKTGFHYVRRLLQPFANINTRSTLTFATNSTNNPTTNTQGTGMAQRLLGGWQLSGIVTATTGLPFNVILNAGVNNGAPSWPNRIASGVLSNRGPSDWFNASAFVAPPPNTYGNVAKSVLYGPGHLEVDVSLVKAIKVHERGTFEFRFEAFNLFNSPFFDVPNAAIGSPTVGQITSTVADNRNLEAALKFMF